MNYFIPFVLGTGRKEVNSEKVAEFFEFLKNLFDELKFYCEKLGQN
jgi:hypothetical protein